jgi:hypothetical protein
MTYKEQFEREKRWYKRVVILDFYHNSKLFHNKKWKVADTAKIFGISVGHCSESIMLCNAIKEQPELEKLSRNQALKHIRCNGR